MSSVSLLRHQRVTAPSVYGEEAYGLALAQDSNQEWCLLADAHDMWTVPVLLRAIEGGGYEAASPYGYPGIYANDSLHPNQITSFWSNTLRALREANVVSLFLRFPPFASSGLGIEDLTGLEGLELTKVSQTVEVSASDRDESWNGMSGRARTAVRKAIKVGMKASVHRADESSLGPCSAFRRLYAATMNRIEAASHHIYGDSYYSTLFSKLADRTMVVDVKTAEGDPAASAIIFIDSNVVHYHLSGSDPGAARNGANNLLLWTIIEWSAGHGFDAVHLGGGLVPGDSLFKFKESFGGTPRDFWVGRAVVEPNRYNELSRRRAVALNVSLSELESTGFFPTFRAEL